MARIGRKSTLKWIQEDYRSNPVRFCCEVIGMISNLIASLILMWYSPNPPMFLAYIFFLIDNDIPGQVKDMEPYLLGALNDLKGRFSFVTEVRGKGLLAAMDFDSDISGQVLTAANESGILLNGPRPHTIRFMPPLNITKEEIDEGVDRLGTALATI